ncbi:macro domain-containing protein [bacterium]|nr:macro domain-containing protein [bacterium]
MLNLEYKKGDLFSNLKEEAIHLHANNASGNWGKGIAKMFRARFPGAYEAHINRPNSVGDGYFLDEDDYKVGCLITSHGYGKRKDPPSKILVQTYMSIQKLLESIDENEIFIQSPKINSGKFAVRWGLTAKVIKRACSKYPDKNVNWTVWEL